MTTTTFQTSTDRRISRRLLTLAIAAPLPGENGAVQALSRAWNAVISRPPYRTPLGATATGRVLRDLAERPKWTRTGWVHPGVVATTSSTASRGRAAAALRYGTDDPAQAALTPADVLWLQRLPQDPDAVTFDDAVAIARLAAAHGDRTSSDGRLIESVWRPIAEVHDAREAEHQLTLATRPMPPIPGELLDALEETMTREDPDLPSDVIYSRAQALTRDAITSRDTDRDRAADQARTRIAELKAAASARRLTTRAVP